MRGPALSLSLAPTGPSPGRGPRLPSSPVRPLVDVGSSRYANYRSLSRPRSRTSPVPAPVSTSRRLSHAVAVKLTLRRRYLCTLSPRRRSERIPTSTSYVRVDREIYLYLARLTSLSLHPIEPVSARDGTTSKDGTFSSRTPRSSCVRLSTHRPPFATYVRRLSLSLP